MPKKLPFTKDDYRKMLDTKLGNTPQPINLIEKVRQAAARLKGIRK